MKRYSVPVYGLRLVRERTARYGAPTVEHASHAAAVIRAAIGDADREHMVAVFLDGQSNVTGVHVVAIGSVSSIGTITPREVFKAAIVANASAIILGHNHPSGDVTPSAQDLDCTRRLMSASRVVGIPILDHVIVAKSGPCHSMRESEGDMFS